MNAAEAGTAFVQRNSPCVPAIYHLVDVGAKHLALRRRQPSPPLGAVTRIDPPDGHLLKAGAHLPLVLDVLIERITYHAVRRGLEDVQPLLLTHNCATIR